MGKKSMKKLVKPCDEHVIEPRCSAPPLREGSGFEISSIIAYSTKVPRYYNSGSVVAMEFFNIFVTYFYQKQKSCKKFYLYHQKTNKL